MWEVVWTDPDKESVREHRERKATQREQREQREKSRVQHKSTSNRSSASSDSKSFGLFGSKSLKRTVAPKPKTSAASLLANPDHEAKSRRVSYLSTAAAVASISKQPSETLTGAVQLSNLSTGPDQFIDSFQNSPGSSNRDSVFSKWTENSAFAPGSPCNTSVTESTAKSAQYVQTLGPSSFITKDTEVTVSPRTEDNDITSVVSEVRITANPVKEDPLTPSHSPTVSQSVSIESPAALLTNQSLRNLASLKSDVPISLFPGQASPPRNSLTQVPSWTSAFKPNNPDAWKPPDAWDCVPSPEQRASTFEDIMEESGELEDDMALSLDLNAMQREIKRMGAASYHIRLIRLKETWGVSDDASLYKELEMEKKRWMLSSLDHMDKPVDLDPAKPAPLKVAASRSKKVLALYESQATASYLAAVHCNKNIYHLSPSPLSHNLFPNIHPVMVPTVSSTAFPIAQGLFGAVYSLSLPALVPSPEVPTILKSIHRALSLGGTFHLTLIDPLPLATTLGPRLRAWLDEHLLFNLERNFRCMNPSKLFPIWLADALLRADGSTITTVKFFAVMPPTRGPSTANLADAPDKAVKQELRTLVGRMLWKEVWGPFIQAKAWWWEDPAIVEECHHMRTMWDYSKIEAVKDL